MSETSLIEALDAIPKGDTFVCYYRIGDKIQRVEHTSQSLIEVTVNFGDGKSMKGLVNAEGLTGLLKASPLAAEPKDIPASAIHELPPGYQANLPAGVKITGRRRETADLESVPGASIKSLVIDAMERTRDKGGTSPRLTVQDVFVRQKQTFTDLPEDAFLDLGPGGYRYEIIAIEGRRRGEKAIKPLRGMEWRVSPSGFIHLHGRFGEVTVTWYRGVDLEPGVTKVSLADVPAKPTPDLWPSEVVIDQDGDITTFKNAIFEHHTDRPSEKSLVGRDYLVRSTSKRGRFEVLDLKKIGCPVVRTFFDARVSYSK